MNINEFEKKAKAYNIAKVIRDGKLNTGYDNNKSLYIDTQNFNIYGCDFVDKKYVIYFIDPEREIIKEIGIYDTKDEAFDNLFKTIKDKKDK